ncbi:MAG: hypothetical protein HMLIMOIP_002205 [Candidatus Nitrosomirales archaeon]|jgi:hypothetical protein
MRGIQSLLQKCRYEKNIDAQIDILFQINRSLPYDMQLKLPSLFTDDYVRTALDTIEEKLLVVISGNSRIP